MNKSKVISVLNFGEDNGFGFTIIFVFAFYLMFITECFDGINLNSVTKIILWIFIYSPLFWRSDLDSWKRTNAVNIGAMLEFLPIKKEQLIKGRMIRSNIAVLYLLIPYISMYLVGFNSSDEIIARGILSVFMIFFVISSVIISISKYDEKFSMLRKLSLIMYLLVFLMILVVDVYSHFNEKIIYFIQESHFFILLGSNMVGIALGLITLLICYYFNYIYIKKKIKKGNWTIK